MILSRLWKNWISPPSSNPQPPDALPQAEQEEAEDSKSFEEEYQVLLRSLRWTEAFGMLFVECSTPQADEIISRVRQDLSGKTIEVMALTQPITNLYDRVNALPNKDQINVLFIRGIEYSILDYEQTEFGEDLPTRSTTGLKPGDSSSDRYTYSWKNVPQLLGHLNLSRERFRDSFPFCFVFLVPHFALKYLIRRAPDFFDWRSGVLQLPMDAKRLQQESLQAYLERETIEAYETLNPEDRRQAIIKIKALLDEPQQTPQQKADLYHELGLLYATAKEFGRSIASYDKALEIKPDYYQAWNNRGNSLYKLGRYEEAIASYD